ELIGQHRTADAGEVNTNLVRPAGPRMDAAERIAAEPFDHLVEAGRFLAVVFLVRDRHLDAVFRMMGDSPLDVIAVAVEYAGCNCHVFLKDLTQLKLHAEVAVSRFVLGDENDAAGVAVEAMNDAGPIFTAQSAQFTEVEAQGVDQRAAPVPLGRV